MTKQKKFYYIQCCPYGVRISPDSLNGNAFSYYAFPSYTERQKWLDEHDMDVVNWVAAPITRAELVERIGKRFYVVSGLYNYNDSRLDVLSYDDEMAQWGNVVYKSF